MPTGLKHYQQTGNLHFLTFSCYGRAPLLANPSSRDFFVATLERTRIWYGFYITGFVVMPEHVHLLLSEPERSNLAVVLQMLKQVVSRRLRGNRTSPFWLERYYDFNVFTQQKLMEKLDYLHRNPVERGLASCPEDWAWSSARHYATGIDSVVEIESHWTARRRERRGLHPTVRVREIGGPPFRKKREKDGAPRV